ncbi:TPA: ATP synthase F1 subunit gamma [Candidatus Berkelbacteria bacterium]|uniref:ATP synthase gamma chain n=1 Tax=Berkelbacteria bacterium GW2011_GWE1_39_12 TaxID=1618337 RepID=A0A0G4B4F3_9BACT|nr:MAG: ATP synthase F1 subunit gamma, F-type H+-transporting ATPase subunit gamma [Berkelbacteria bacterium GW2011_GWE1_39_12]HBO60869.1 ATP synthase F1 subunit gamma [Candidatus Berkelbacteria bacterium]
MIDSGSCLPTGPERQKSYNYRKIQMPNTKEIRIRIKAIGSTAKITKAMEMVAASKMKKSQDTAVKNRDYATASYEVLCNLQRDESCNHILLSNNEAKEKNLLIVVTSDKGLCGSYNTSVIRKALEYIKANPETDIIAIGKKGQKLLSALGKNVIGAYTDFPINAKEYDVAPIITQARTDFTNNIYKEVAVCYTEFQSTIKQKTELKQLIPFNNDVIASEAKQSNNDKIAASPSAPRNDEVNFKFEPSCQEVIDYIVPRIIETQFYQMILESIASEQSARMMAMKNATDAADDLIEDLELTYNSIRQGSITQELAEISAAVNAGRTS